MIDARAFRGFRFPAEVILRAVRWYPQVGRLAIRANVRDQSPQGDAPAGDKHLPYKEISRLVRQP
jgi:hypothetical protein